MLFMKYICQESSVLLAPIFQRRFDPVIIALRKALKEKRFGELLFVNAFVHWYRAPEYYSESSWKGTWELDGGAALMNQGIHTADLLVHLFGMPEIISARASNKLHKDIEAEDVIHADLQFSEETPGCLQITTACHSPKGNPIEIVVRGTKGTCKIVDQSLQQWSFEEERSEDRKILEEYGFQEGGEGQGAADPVAIQVDGHRKNFANIIGHLQDECELLVSAPEALHSIDFVEKAYTLAGMRS